MQNINISIAIPTFNRITYLKKVLPSYLSQEMVSEVIIINDCSTDSTNTEIRKLTKNNPKLRIISNTENYGAPYSRNIAIKQFKGTHLFYGEDDLMLPENYLKTLLEHMLQSKADVIAGRRIWMTDGESKEDALNRANSYKGSPFNKSDITTNCQIKTENDCEMILLDASMLIKRDVFNKVKYDIEYGGNYWREESDFQISCLENKFRLIYCPHVACFHLYKNDDKGGCHSKSKYNNFFYSVINTWKFISKHNSILRNQYNLYHSKLLFILHFTLKRYNSRFLIPTLTDLKKTIHLVYGKHVQKSKVDNKVL